MSITFILYYGIIYNALGYGAPGTSQNTVPDGNEILYGGIAFAFSLSMCKVFGDTALMLFPNMATNGSPISLLPAPPITTEQSPCAKFLQPPNTAECIPSATLSHPSPPSLLFQGLGGIPCTTIHIIYLCHLINYKLKIAFRPRRVSFFRDSAAIIV